MFRDEKPGRRSFYKYVDPATTLKVLQFKTFRYSSPLRFNDPFEFNSGLHFDFDIEDMPRKAFSRIVEYVLAPEPPQVDQTNPWGQAILKYRELHLSRSIPIERWKEDLENSVARLVHVIRDTQQRLQKHWEMLAPGIRVFCVSEERDNLLMWAHYAKDHSGVVFELLSLPEYDNNLSVSKKVEYIEKPPPFFTEEEWLADLLAIRRINHELLFRRYAYLKSSHWSYEKEWRVWYPEIPPPDEVFSDIEICPNGIAAMYIGCKATEPFSGDAIRLARSAFPNIRIFRAKANRESFSLEHTEV